MSELNFYQVLGVARSATSDEIKAAFRELVKRYHPDLFTRPAEKKHATEKLRQINEAYAVLGNAQRRRKYDESFARPRKPEIRRPPPRQSRTQRSQPRASRASARRRFKARFAMPFKIPWNLISRKRAGYALAATVLALLVFYAAGKVPVVTTGWALVEKVEVSSIMDPVLPQGTQNWSIVAEFDSMADCTGTLKAVVRENERQGARAVVDEENGMMAILIKVGKDAGAGVSNSQQKEEKRGGVRGEASPGDPPVDPTAPIGSLESTIKHVRNLECRATRRLKTESRAQRALRNLSATFSR